MARVTKIRGLGDSLGRLAPTLRTIALSARAYPKLAARYGGPFFPDPCLLDQVLQVLQVLIRAPGLRFLIEKQDMQDMQDMV